tara:strand:- start:85 stop:327 length:243 start_codon:yes stop_codon:yes gene_type:complete
MDKIESKILRALQTNKLNPNILGERNWYKYFIAVDELVWSRNLWNGYNINIYTDRYKSEHLGNYWIGFDICFNPFLKNQN